MRKSGLESWISSVVPIATQIGIATSARTSGRRGSQGRMTTHSAPMITPANRPPNRSSASVPSNVIAPMTLSFSVRRPAASGSRSAATRIRSRPPIPPTTTPTMSPASPPRAISRRTSKPGWATAAAPTLRAGPAGRVGGSHRRVCLVHARAACPSPPQPVADRRVPVEHLIEVAVRQAEQDARRLGDRGRGARPVVDQRDLAEKSARPDRVDRCAALRRIRTVPATTRKKYPS